MFFIRCISPMTIYSKHDFLKVDGADLVVRYADFEILWDYLVLDDLRALVFRRRRGGGRGVGRRRHEQGVRIFRREQQGLVRTEAFGTRAIEPAQQLIEPCP